MREEQNARVRSKSTCKDCLLCLSLRMSISILATSDQQDVQLYKDLYEYYLVLFPNLFVFLFTYF